MDGASKIEAPTCNLCNAFVHLTSQQGAELLDVLGRVLVRLEGDDKRAVVSDVDERLVEDRLPVVRDGHVLEIAATNVEWWRGHELAVLGKSKDERHDLLGLVFVIELGVNSTIQD